MTVETRPEQARSRTKIVATVGPACRAPEKLTELVETGVDIFRLNMAHAGLDEHTRTLQTIRQISRTLNRPIGVLADLAGPKIRLGELPNEMIDCAPGSEFRFVRGEESTAPDEMGTTYEPLVDELAVGDTVMLADGTVSLVVIEKTQHHARARVVQGGIVRSRQGLNLPGVKLNVPSMDAEDRECALWAAEHGVDFVGLSFVRRAQDVLELKELLKSRNGTVRVIAKIEKQEALDELEAVIAAADGVMVARGDLGVEIDVAQMPVVQKRIVSACQAHQKPVIIATQMLDSMQHSRRPTRAEVTDVANAILDGGDACMLSGETAIGHYPREAVEMMKRVALATEELFRDNVPRSPREFRAENIRPITSAVVYGAGHMAAQIRARQIVVASHSGATALALSKQRNYVPTVGISDSESTLRQMCLYWGVIPLMGVPAGRTEDMLEAVTAWGLGTGSLRSGDHLVLVAGIGIDDPSHNQVVVHRVQ